MSREIIIDRDEDRRAAKPQLFWNSRKLPLEEIERHHIIDFDALQRAETIIVQQGDFERVLKSRDGEVGVMRPRRKR
jgi:hypothetical protein